MFRREDGPHYSTNIALNGARLAGAGLSRGDSVRRGIDSRPERIPLTCALELLRSYAEARLVLPRVVDRGLRSGCEHFFCPAFAVGLTNRSRVTDAEKAINEPSAASCGCASGRNGGAGSFVVIEKLIRKWRFGQTDAVTILRLRWE